MSTFTIQDPAAPEPGPAEDPLTGPTVENEPDQDPSGAPIIHVEPGPQTHAPTYFEQILSPRPPTHDDIARLAYTFWVRGGKAQGSAEEDWRKAQCSLWSDYVHAVDVREGRRGWKRDYPVSSTKTTN